MTRQTTAPWLGHGFRAHAEMLQTVLDHMPTPIVCTSARALAGAVYFNYAFTDLFGYGADDIHSLPDWTRLAFPEEAVRQHQARAWATAVEAALTQDKPIAPLQARIRCKDGTRRDVILQATLFDSLVLMSFTDVTERQQAAEAMRRSEERFRLMFDHASAGIFLVGLDGRILKTNPMAHAMFGYGPGELDGLTVNDITLAPDAALSPQAMHSLIEGRSDPVTIEKRYRHKNGHVVHGLVSVALVRDAAQQPSYFVSQVQDISQRIELEERLRISERRYRLLADNVADVLWTIDLTGHITYMSPSILRYRGFTPQELMQTPLADQFTPESLALVQQGLEVARADVQAGRPVNFRGEVQERCKDGRLVWSEITATSLYDTDGRFLEIVGVSRNIDERKRYEQELLRLASTDTLTGTWNRRRLEEACSAAIERAQRYDEPTTLLLMDIDHFKSVNDRYGHAVGDRVLVELAHRIRAHLRTVDVLGRWGGEEFVVLAAPCDAQAGVALAEKLRGVIADQVFEGAGTMTISLGVAQWQHHESLHQWFQHADGALYRAKTQGRNRVVVAQATGPITGHA